MSVLSCHVMDGSSIWSRLRMVENRVLFSHENGDKALARDGLESIMPRTRVATRVLDIVRRAKSD